MKKLLTVLAFLLCSCAAVPYQGEYNAYVNLIQSQVASRQITLEQGNYLIAQKENELRARSSAALNAGIANAYPGLGLAAQGSQKRTVPGVTCTTTGMFTNCY